MGNKQHKEPPLFDQTFTSYLDSKNIAHAPYKREHSAQHTARNTPEHNTGCLLLKRDIYFQPPTTPPSTSEEFSLEDIKIIQALLAYESGPRTYLAHIPASATPHINFHNSGSVSVVTLPNSHSTASPTQPARKKFPLVILLHGTDETAFDTELIEKSDWLQSSDTKEFIVVYPQSRAQNATGSLVNSSWRSPEDPLRSLWLLSIADKKQLDHHFIQAVVDDMCGWLDCIDMDKINIIGFSNGGFMAADSLLHLNLFSFTPSAVCCYMGGLEPEQISSVGLIAEQLPPAPDIKIENETGSAELPALFIPFDSPYTPTPLPVEDLPPHCKALSKPRKPNVLVITGDLDVQLSSCCSAWEIFSLLNFKTQLYILKDSEHEYFASSTPIICDFFSL